MNGIDRTPRQPAASSRRRNAGPAAVLPGRVPGWLASLALLLLLLLSACASPGPPPPSPPPVLVADSTWWQVDRDIAAAARAATVPAGEHAGAAMAKWRQRVQHYCETDFIPWFTSYGTQQWLAIKVAWYRLGSEATADPAAGRLAAYLQEQYQERVLDPVVREVDPAMVRETATRIYQRTLGAALTGIRQRHAVPTDQFDRRLQRIPAISLAPPPAHDASLHQFIHADPLAALPAYGALLGRIRAAAAGSGGGADDSRLSPAARRASEQALARLTASGAASAAAAIIGGVPGAVISLGAFGVGLAAHEKQRPEIETQLRANLDAALAETWHSLIENRASSVMAAVHYLATRIDDALTPARSQPVELAPGPQEIPFPAAPGLDVENLHEDASRDEDEDEDSDEEDETEGEQ